MRENCALSTNVGTYVLYLVWFVRRHQVLDFSIQKITQLHMMEIYNLDLILHFLYKLLVSFSTNNK